MAGASRGTPAFQTFTGSTSGTLTTAWAGDQTHAVPATLACVVFGANASSTAVTCSTPANWNLDTNYPKLLSNGINRLGMWAFLRDADGVNDAAPSFSVTNAAGGLFVACLLDLTGLQGSTSIDLDFTPESFTSSGAESLSALTNTQTDFCIAFWGGRGTSSVMTWTSPLSALVTSASGAVVCSIATTRYTSIGSQSPAGSSNVGSNILGAIAFKEFGAPVSLNAARPRTAQVTRGEGSFA